MRALRNEARGEVLLSIDGAPRNLCLTLGALAELEAAFDVGNFAELGVQLAHLCASDLIVVIAALLKGGGETMSPADIAAARIDPREAAEAVASAFSAVFADGE